MDRRTFLGALAGGLLAAPLAAEAQQPGRCPAHRRSSATDHVLASELPGASERGCASSATWKEDHRSSSVAAAAGHYERVPPLAAELVRLKVDVIVADGLSPARGGQAGDEDDPHRHGERWRIRSGAGSSPASPGPAGTSPALRWRPRR